MWFLLFFSRKYVKTKNATNKLCKFSGVNSLKATTHEEISQLENCQDPWNKEKSDNILNKEFNEIQKK